MRDAMAGIMAESLKNSKIPQLDSDGRYDCMGGWMDDAYVCMYICMNIWMDG
jgi:hypothetical protein